MKLKRYRLSELLTIKNGKDYKHLNEGDIPVFGSGGYMLSVDSYLYDKASILLPRKGTLSNIQFYDKGKFWTVDTCFYSIINEKLVVPYYLYRYLRSLDLSGYDTGASIPSMTQKTYNSIKVDLPSVPVQKRIASILSAYDSQIENNQKRIKLLEQMAENLYKEWFVRFRFPGYETAEFEGGMPKGWTRCKLGDLIDFQNGFAFKSETFVPEGKYKVITIKNVQDGQFDSSNADRVEDIPKGMPSYCKLSEGDILLSLTGNVGRVCHVIGDNMLLNQRVAKIKSSHSHFAYCMLRTPAMFAYLNMIAYGTAQLNLSPIKAANLKIIKPTESIMEAFDKVVAPLFSSVFNLYNQIDFLSSQRDLLLPRLMSGKLSI